MCVCVCVCVCVCLCVCLCLCVCVCVWTAQRWTTFPGKNTLAQGVSFITDRLQLETRCVASGLNIFNAFGSNYTHSTLITMEERKKFIISGKAITSSVHTLNASETGRGSAASFSCAVSNGEPSIWELGWIEQMNVHTMPPIYLWTDVDSQTRNLGFWQPGNRTRASVGTTSLNDPSQNTRCRSALVARLWKKTSRSCPLLHGKRFLPTSLNQCTHFMFRCIQIAHQINTFHRPIVFGERFQFHARLRPGGYCQLQQYWTNILLSRFHTNKAVPLFH